jgi:hypothetical protein
VAKADFTTFIDALVKHREGFLKDISVMASTLLDDIVEGRPSDKRLAFAGISTNMLENATYDSPALLESLDLEQRRPDLSHSVCDSYDLDCHDLSEMNFG